MALGQTGNNYIQKYNKFVFSCRFFEFILFLNNICNNMFNLNRNILNYVITVLKNPSFP